MQFPTPTDTEQIEARIRAMRVLWIALVGSLGVYFVFTLMVQRPENVQPNRPLSLGLLGATLFTAAGSFVVQSLLVSRAVQQRQPAMVQQAYFVTWAVTEVGGLLAFVDYFVTSDPYYYALILIAAGAQLLHFPRRSHVIDAVFGPTGN